jgi:hypothetical protein
MTDKVKEAWFTINKDFEIRYLKGKGYIPYIVVDKTLVKEWVAYFKDISVNSLTLYQTHKGYDKIIKRSRCYASLEEAINVEKDLHREVWFYDPDTHVKLECGYVISKKQLKKEVDKIVDELDTKNNSCS